MALTKAAASCKPAVISQRKQHACSRAMSNFQEEFYKYADTIARGKMRGEAWEGVCHAGVGDQPAWERGLRGSSVARMDPGGKQGPSGEGHKQGIPWSLSFSR